MPKPNKGTTTKLSIRLSYGAEEYIEKAASNLGTSKAGVILLELSKIFKNLPSHAMVEEYKETITLKPDHFAMSVNEKVSDRINELVEKYGMRKNVLIGYIISNHFDPNNKDLEPKKFMVQINSSLLKKMKDYSEKYFIDLSVLVADSILEGPYEGMPIYDREGSEQFFTNVPGYIRDMVNEKADEMNIRSHLYTSLCLYKQFMRPEGKYFE
ncbi:hypothetical protein [Peribacillus simplex]|uniref:hypothetical protein n=1 Tax=Peribacillus simplex TaxID=1478 RepID=UPI0024BFA0E9|nr:hypothetical protein [Peribacillus simplex]WHY95391.1 hypothetical protein QNH37_15330 [Peribacillus simplex]